MEPVEPVPYNIKKEDGTSGPTSRGYSGSAEVTYSNSDTYVGDFKNGVKEGHGTYSFINGDKYTGGFKDNLQFGIGRTEYAKGGKYYGNYDKGLRNGEGVFNFANGDIYSGSWKDNLKHGPGTYIVNSAKLDGNNYMKIVGQWSHGEILSGKWIFPDGTYYEGIFEKNLPKNTGVWNFKNGNTTKGDYKHSEARDIETSDIKTKLTWYPDEETFDPRINKISG